MTHTTSTATAPALPATLRAGLIAGLVAAIAANLTYLAYVALTGNTFAELTVISITLAGILPSLVGALVYQQLAKRLANAATIFRAVGVTFAVLSTIPQFIQPLHEGFALASGPLHIVVGVVVVWLVPVLAPGGHRDAA